MSTEPTPEFDITKAGPMTLRQRGISFAVDQVGQVLRYPDGTPIDGDEIEGIVNGSGRRLTNAQAAGQLVVREEFVTSVESKLVGLRNPGNIEED